MHELVYPTSRASVQTPNISLPQTFPSVVVTAQPFNVQSLTRAANHLTMVTMVTMVKAAVETAGPDATTFEVSIFEQ